MLIFLSLTLITTSLTAQPDTKIEKKLNKLFIKGKFEKCQTKALKLNKKYPKSDIPEFYISKVNIRQYSLANKNDRNSYNHLKKAVTYSGRLPDSYNDWKVTVQDSIRYYIFYMHDSLPDSRKFKTVLKFYTRTYKDTLVFIVADEQLNQVSIYNFTKSNTDSLRLELIKFAEKQDGTRYSYAGEKPETGFDCSGFTKYVYSCIGIEIPHNAHKQSTLEGDNKSLSEARPGDLIFFGSKTGDNYYTVHTGIVHSVYEDDISVIHCVSGGVSIDGKDSSWDRYWKDEVLFVKSLPELQK